MDDGRDEPSRYEILERIGEGGMGEVYRARDRRLERDVAIKRLKSWVLDDYAQVRLAREAQTLAQLSHPNVVEIYERIVEDAGFALVMELVRGPTLSQWRRAEPRGWREVLGVFRQAARGLAAAHEAGVVHRDFKPANVMLGDDDGRVRVMDFGVAKPPGAPTEAHESSEPLGPSPRADSAGWDAVLTATGTVVGTPAYMAPEQFQGLPADGRADQYAFCVALWEALGGDRPFSGDSYVELGRAKLRETPVWPKRVRVPRRLIRAILRGLRPQPEERWPSMRRLIAELDAAAEPPRARRAIAAAAVLTPLTAATAAAAIAWPDPPSTDCDERALRASMWSDERRERLELAVLATEAPYAPGTWETLSRTLDTYAHQWAEQRTALCADPSAHDPLVDDRARCLRAHRDAFEAVIGVLAEADHDGLAEASQAVTQLPPLEACREGVALDAEPALLDTATRERVVAHRRELAWVRSLTKARRCAQASDKLDQMQPAVEQIDFAPLRGALGLARGGAARCRADYEQAVESYEEVYFLATEQGLGSMAIEAALELASIIGITQGYRAEGERWAEHARAELARHPDPLARARYHELVGELHHVASRYESAIESYREGLRVLEDVSFGEQPRRQLAGKISDSLRVLGQLDEARAIVEELVAAGERMLGPEHPAVARRLVSLATLYNEAGETELAETTLRRSIGLLERVYVPEHPILLRARGNLAMTVSLRGRHREAIELHQHVVEGMARRFGDDHPNVATALNNLGIDQLSIEDPSGAAASHRRALEIREHALGMDHMLTASSLNNLAEVQLALGQLEAARAGFARALPIFEAALGRDVLPVSYPLVGLGTVLNEQGRFDEATPPLERALSIRESAPCPEFELIESRFQLARALYGSGTERARARTLAKSVLERVEDQDTERVATHAALVVDVRAWLRHTRASR